MSDSTVSVSQRRVRSLSTIATSQIHHSVEPAYMSMERGLGPGSHSAQSAMQTMSAFLSMTTHR